MINNYIHMKSGDIIVNDPLADVAARVTRAKQQQFLADNHHLISPWMYTPQQYAMRNRALFLREFDRSSRRLAESYKGVTGVVPVIAWEFERIPDEPWGGNPRVGRDIYVIDFRTGHIGRRV